MTTNRIELGNTIAQARDIGLFDDVFFLHGYEIFCDFLHFNELKKR